MKKFILATLAAAVMTAGLSGLASSHHSHSMFDHDNEVTITGTVKKFTFSNPHLFLYIDVRKENDSVVNYWVEMSNIPNMIRRGIGSRTFQPGDVVTVNMYPLKDGRPGGNYTTIIAADGKIYD